jgi:uncharacterized protein (DUF427 family)
MKLPGPDHPIAIEKQTGRVRVTYNGRVIADTTDALVLKEASLRPVLYLPRADAQTTLFERSPHKTHCPYKGDASYYTIRVDGKVSENAIWSYEQPFPAMVEITDRIAFYPERVDGIEVVTA